MRYYAWYAPQENVIVLQTIMEDCYIAFEWDHQDLYDVMSARGIVLTDDDPLWTTLLVPLGEL